MSGESIRLYSSHLVKQNIDDVIMALDTLAALKREEFEPAIPELGGLMQVVSAMAVARHNRETAQKNQYLVRWECPACGATVCGFPARGSDLDRRCYKKTTVDRAGNPQECGAPMNVIFEDAA